MKMKTSRVEMLLRMLQLVALLLASGSPARASSWEVVASHVVGDGAPALSAPIGAPRAIAIDGEGRLYISDTQHARIRRVDQGRIDTVAGTGATGYDGDRIAAAT